jgi:hypothetical protein
MTLDASDICPGVSLSTLTSGSATGGCQSAEDR